jgi:tRNA(Arg) A34 adenosine deaminase TadA
MPPSPKPGLGCKRAEFPSAASSFTRERSSDGDTTDAFKKEARFYTEKWTLLKMPDAKVYRKCILFTTLSPCPMCSGAILLYGIPKIIVGENQTFLGEEELLRSRGVDVEVLQNKDCLEMMRQFIQEKPELWNEDIGV